MKRKNKTTKVNNMSLTNDEVKEAINFLKNFYGENYHKIKYKDLQIKISEYWFKKGKEYD